MSTNSECLVVERTPGQWFYVLEDYNAPKNAWNWREHAEAYGPFSSEAAAEQHLFDNHANPGGYNTTPFANYIEDATMKALLDGAHRPGRRALASENFDPGWLIARPGAARPSIASLRCIARLICLACAACMLQANAPDRRFP